MLFASVNSLKALSHLSKPLDGVELRLDLFDQIDFATLKDLIKNSPFPLLLTLRSLSQGGLFQGNQNETESFIERLLQLEPPFLDLEYTMRPSFILEMFQKFPKTKYILSYHNFKEVPKDLKAIYENMAKHPAFTYKIAVTPHSSTETLKTLLFARTCPNISLICMGEIGSFARILGPIQKNIIDYGSVQEKTAPGQLSIQELINTYRYFQLNRETALYGLIGDPVLQSIGHIHHNRVFETKNLNALYVKMIVKEDELSSFFPLAKEIGFSGLSVTMPLKEKVLPFLDTLDLKAEQMGSVNTLLFKNNKLLGFNTDGIGALDAIEKRGPVLNKKIVILGFGGSGKAIAFEAKLRGASVLILNRTIDKDQICRSLSDIPKQYDILINCTSTPMPIDPSTILPSSLVMDIVYSPKNTPFLEKAKSLGSEIIYGEEMFLNQAAAQTSLWT